MADANEQERFDPTRLIGRVTVVVLALAGAALVLLPSTQFGWDEIKGGWAARPTLWIANLTALIGIALAMAIAWSREAHRAAPLLAAALGAGASAWGLRSADSTLGFNGLAADAIRFAQYGTWVVAAAMISAFSTHFPRPLTRADLDDAVSRIDAGTWGSGLTAREDPFAVMDVPTAAWDRWVKRLFGATVQEQLRAIISRRGWQIDSGAEQARARQLFSAPLWFFRDAWLVVLAFLPLLAVLVAFGLRRVEMTVYSMPLSLGACSCFALRYTTMNAGAEERRRVLWIAAGTVGAFVVVQLMFWGFMLSALFQRLEFGIGLFILSAPLAALVLVLGFAIATFGSGALDPTLAIKRTLVTGIVTTLLTFMFALVEATVATLLADQAGLPSSAAPAIASAAVAVALGPMWSKTSVWVSAKLGVTAPASRTT